MPRAEFRRPEHRIIARALGLTRAGLLLDCGCWFGGGTAIVMKHGEYRLSLDVDVLCSSREGFDKAARAYPDVLDGVRKVVTEIGERPQRLADAAEVLRMDPGLARRAVSAVARQVVGTAPGSVGPAGADGP